MLRHGVALLAAAGLVGAALAPAPAAAQATEIPISNAVMVCPGVGTFTAVPSAVLPAAVRIAGVGQDDPDAVFVPRGARVSAGLVTGARLVPDEITCTVIGTGANGELLSVRLQGAALLLLSPSPRRDQ